MSTKNTEHTGLILLSVFLWFSKRKYIETETTMAMQHIHNIFCSHLLAKGLLAKMTSMPSQSGVKNHHWFGTS